jgi:hypothetical protein
MYSHLCQVKLLLQLNIMPQYSNSGSQPVCRKHLPTVTWRFEEKNDYIKLNMHIKRSNNFLYHIIYNWVHHLVLQ